MKETTDIDIVVIGSGEGGAAGADAGGEVFKVTAEGAGAAEDVAARKVVRAGGAVEDEAFEEGEFWKR